jgi:uncharacterized membrane protein
MDTGKIKNIIIIILLAVNIFLLCAVVGDRVQARRAERSAWRSAVTAVEKGGITVSSSLKGSIPTPKLYSVRRDIASEGENVKRLLGECRADDLGGNIWFYSSTKGQASFRGTGECDILFTSGAFGGSDNVAKTAQKAMKKLGLDCDVSSLSVTEDGGARTVKASCAWQGGRVYNAQISMTFSGEGLLILSGTRVFDQTVSESSQGVMDQLTVMMRFVEIVQEEGYVCSLLQSMDVGYIMGVSVSGESTLTPVWHFATDAGDIYINALTGKTETVA